MEPKLTTEELAELCRTSTETIRYWRHAGKGPIGYRIGKRVLYDAADVASWLAAARDADSAA